ncbi:unnamed protein product [Alopecurus aequalis]
MALAAIGIPLRFHLLASLPRTSPCLLFAIPLNSSERERERAAAMAGQVSKEELRGVLMHAMLAAKSLRPQRDRLLQLQRRLKQLSVSPGDDDADSIKQLASDIFKLYFTGIEAGARMLSTCLELAVNNGARFAVNPAFATMPDEQLHDVLLAQRLPARPTTQAEAFSRVEAALYAVKLPQEYHLPHCVEHLVGEYPTLRTHKCSADKIGEVIERLEKAKIERLAKAKISPAIRSGVDLDKARDYLVRACVLASLAVKHIDLAVAVLSSFLDPKEVASLSDFTDKRAYISEGPYPSD